MKQILDCYNGSFTAFESWNLTDFSDRKEALEQLAAQLPEQLKKVFNYQLIHAGSVVSKTESLVSPTGETNELYTQGRGVSALLVSSEHANSTTALVAMMAALLASGNCVIICSDNLRVKELVEAAIAKQSLPENLVQVVEKERYSELLELDIRNFAFIGCSAETAQISQALAMRTSAITSMVVETNLEALPNAKDPMLVLRFITEKVRSINITAIGGNAMLLELGNTAH